MRIWMRMESAIRTIPVLAHWMLAECATGRGRFTRVDVQVSLKEHAIAKEIKKTPWECVRARVWQTLTMTEYMMI